MRLDRYVIEGTQVQGEDEEIPWGMDVSKCGAILVTTGTSVIVKDVTDDDTDVTSTVMPSGIPSVSGTIITLPPILNLVEGHTYRVNVLFSIDGRKLSGVILLDGQE